MDLTSGFQIHSPSKFIPWRLRDLELEDLLDGKPLRKVRRGFTRWIVSLYLIYIAFLDSTYTDLTS
jgi:hypothetical protein